MFAREVAAGMAIRPLLPFGVLVLLAVLSSGCLWVYTPSRINTPLAANDREFTVSGGLSAAGLEGHLVATTRSTPLRAEHRSANLLFAAGASGTPARDGMTSDVEAGVGGAFHFERFPRLRLETQVLGGGGHVCDCEDDDEWVRGNFGFVGQQTAAAFDGRWGAVGVALRTTYHSMTGRTGPAPEGSAPAAYSAVFVEPVAIVRIGPRWLRLEAQLGYSADIEVDNPHEFSTDDGQGTIGLVSTFPF